MQRRTPSPRSRKAGALATAALTLTAVTAGGLAASPASADPTATTVSLFPTDALTVPDATQVTGKRMNLPTAGCSSVPACGTINRINELDGFDLDPRLALRFDAPVNVDDVIASTSITGPKSANLGIDRVVYDPDGHVVYAHPVHQLDPMSTYTLHVSGERGLPAAETTFTTLSAPDGLLDLRRELDSGRAYNEASIPLADRGLSIDAVVPADGTTFTYNADTGSGDLVSTQVPALGPGQVVFGSFLAPQWIRPDRTIAQVPTAQAGPSPVGSARLPFVLVLPNTTAPAGGFQTALFGHGFTRSDADVLVAALTNSVQGVATIATDVVGHGFGPRSTWTFTPRDGEPVTVPAYGRGIDLDGNGTITAFEGSTALPNGDAAGVSSRDGLRQTAADNMTLLRAVTRGLDVLGAPESDLRTTKVSYFGQSFGGIYGTMLAGADPKVDKSALNVAGGPVTEVARLSNSFRPLLAQALQFAGLLNSSDPNRSFFQESLPLRGEPPVLNPVPGALAIQQFLAAATWLDRPGSPEAFADILPKQRALFQVAFGDQTVPNPTAYTLLEAGNLFGRAALYRNDRTPSAAANPHTFLLDARTFPAAFVQGQQQIFTFITTGKIVDPDGRGGDVWQVPAPRKVLLPLNFDSPAFP